MIRSEVLKSLLPVISNEFVVCNIGLPSQELHMMDDQPTNFYMLGTMGTVILDRSRRCFGTKPESHFY